MKNTMKYLMLIPLLLITASSSGQAYQTAAGIQIGNDIAGLNAKHFINDKNSVEGIAYIFSNADYIEFSGLYEYNWPLGDITNFTWYAGFGAHIGFWDDGIIFGPDGVLGLEYTLEDAPVNFALDWHPVIHIGSHNDIDFARVGLSVRYAFK